MSYSMEYYRAEDTAVSAVQKSIYDAYPTPEQASHQQLYPRTFPAPSDDSRYSAQFRTGELPGGISSPVMLDSRGLELENSGNYYASSSPSFRSRPRGSPSLLPSPYIRQSSGRQSPSLAGAFGSEQIASVPHLEQIQNAPLPTLRVVSWTPQSGQEGTAVTILLDSLAIYGAVATSTSIPSFGSESPVLGSTAASPQPRAIPTRQFRVLFGTCAVQTRFTRSTEGPRGPNSTNEDKRYIVLSSFVPPRRDMGAPSGRVLVVVQIVDELSQVLEDVIVGEWDSTVSPQSPPCGSPLKRRGEELLSEHVSPVHRNGRNLSNPPMSAPAAVGHWAATPHNPQPLLLSPLTAMSLGSPSLSGSPRIDSDSKSANAIRHPPLEAPAPAQPELIRTSQLTNGSASSTSSTKAVLKLDGDLGTMAVGWTNEEWTCRRRLVQFWRTQDGAAINTTFRPIAQPDFVTNSIVISCIFRDDKNECYVTSVDTIYLLEALVGVRFSVEEKNRIRRNLEGFKPTTVSKSKVESEPFFSTIMGYVAPRPRTIEKDVKVFPWKVLSSALKKIIGKYSATYIGAAMPTRGNDTLSPFPAARAFQSRARSPNPARELEDPNELQEQQRNHISRRDASTGGPSPPNSMIEVSSSQHPIPVSHSRGGSFDFGALLGASAFAGQHYGEVMIPHVHHLFPSAEDYGLIPSDRNVPSPLNANHIRSYSDGTREPIRRSLSGSALTLPISTGNYSIPNPYGDFQAVADGAGHYYTPANDAGPWGFGYDPNNGERRLSASWKAQYGIQGMPMGMGMGISGAYSTYQEFGSA